MYAVNSMSFHPQFGTFVTAGSDGAWQCTGRLGLRSLAKLCVITDGICVDADGI